MAHQIDRKLRLTAAVLGTATMKDLAAAFRRVNAATTFETDRAYKWLQGRARPRELQIYEDWAKVLDLGRSGRWLAECDTDDFLDTVCARHELDREALRYRIDVVEESGHQDSGVHLVGTYACYSHAWSPYFHGRLIRGALSVGAGPIRRTLTATYSEVLPTGRLQLAGTLTTSQQMIHLDLRQISGNAHIVMCLFTRTPPISVLGGFMLGATVIGPDAQPSMSRVAVVRLPGSSARLRDAEAYLPSEGSVAEDLSALGLPIDAPDAVDLHVTEFLTSGSRAGLDQIPVTVYRSLAELFDPAWLAFPVPSFDRFGHDVE